jgi:hypothetical protein
MKLSVRMRGSWYMKPYSTPLLRITPRKSTTSFIVVVSTIVVVLVVIAFDHMGSLLGKRVLLSDDSFLDPGQVVNYPSGLTKGILHLQQIRQDFRKVSGSRGLVSTLGPFPSKTMGMCRRFGNLQMRLAKSGRAYTEEDALLAVPSEYQRPPDAA